MASESCLCVGFVIYHPPVIPILHKYNLGSSDEEARHWLLLDREERVFYIGDRKTVHEFLVKSAPQSVRCIQKISHGPHHPIVHITEEELKGFIDQVKKSVAEIDPNIDLDAIFRENERNFNSLRKWLDSQISIS